ncbi:DUF4431 domain-containing protein [Mesoterricola silvestris]|uniref:DUF4431 domain-containing protein n=1 Tax=Mesoterricola silvestris TaxID=2927979 RepID=UPI00292FB25F|nr:DUF4431 domain-containing protein [Mesoterricola silvestris]
MYLPNRALFSLVLLAGFQCMAVEPALEKLNYGAVVLSGVVVERTEYGPPNFENDGLCKKVKIRCIKLKKPVQVIGNKDDRFNSEDIDNIGVVQIIEPSGKNLRFAIGKKAKIKGVLEQAMTGHHYTKAILSVKDLSDVEIEK